MISMGPSVASAAAFGKRAETLLMWALISMSRAIDLNTWRQGETGRNFRGIPLPSAGQNMTRCHKCLASNRKLGSFHQNVVSIKRADGKNANAGLGQWCNHRSENTDLVQCEW